MGSASRLPSSLRFTAPLPGRLVCGLNPSNQLRVDLLGASELHLAVAHLSGRQLLEAVGNFDTLHVEPDLDPGIGGWADHGELFLPAIPDVGLLRRFLEVPKLPNRDDQLVVDWPEHLLWACVQPVEHLLRRDPLSGGGALPVGLEHGVCADLNEPYDARAKRVPAAGLPLALRLSKGLGDTR